MVVVRFNQFEEFLEELRATPPEDRTVRLTFSLRYDGRVVPHMTMVAGFVGRVTIVEFVQYLGLQPSDPQSPRSEEIRTLLADRKKALEGLGFMVKPGRYQIAGTLPR